VIRYFTLGGIGIILAAKTYVLLYINFVVGIYSLLATSLLLSVFLISYFKFKDPYDRVRDLGLPHNMPLVSIVVPVKNEEGNIRNCVQSCINCTYQNKEVIIVNDGSTDRTTEILQHMQEENGSQINVIHLHKNVGKKQAIEYATNIAKGDIYAFMDSDCDMTSDAIEKAVKIFQSEPKLGALTGHGITKVSDKGNILLKMQEAWFDGQFRIIKGMESSYSSVTCCSGALSLFRRQAIQQFIHEWAHDEFLGIKNFKFATDRMLTAHVLGNKYEFVPTSIGGLHYAYNKNLRTSQMIEDYKRNVNISEYNKSDPYKGANNGRSEYWDVMYSPTIRVNMGVPKKFSQLVKQQIRWRKSFIRSVCSTCRVYWRRPLPIAIIYYLQLVLKLIRPIIIIKTLFLLPLAGDYVTGALYISGVLFTGMIFAVDFKLRNPHNSHWVYRPLMTIISSYVFVWLLFYAMITIRKTTWR
jgi:hyaluronan synthase